jgi:hypothetical protein
MREIYVNGISNPINIILLSTSGGAALNAVWKLRKGMWYIVEPTNEKNIVDRLTPRQFHEAIQNGRYSLRW